MLFESQEDQLIRSAARRLKRRERRLFIAEVTVELSATAARVSRKAGSERAPKNESPKSGKGHGRNGAEAYRGAEKIEIPHEALQPGDACPECGDGTVYETTRPGVLAEDSADGNAKKQRTGLFTSGVVSTREGRRIALFFSSRKHAGENLIDVLAKRAKALAPPIQMCDRFEVAVPPEELVGATRQAIVGATDFDERDMNRNFDYDYDAYIEVGRNLKRLLGLDQLPAAMRLALQLMEEVSRQVEMSDEGLMTDDIKECLMVVIMALKTCNLPTGEVLAWCSAMLENDRVGFICERELKSLRQHIEASTT